MTNYEKSKIISLIKGMTDEEISVVCETLVKRNNERKNKTIDYKVSLNIHAVYDFNGFDNLKSDREFAETLQQFIADEITAGGGVAVIDITESLLYVK